MVFRIFITLSLVLGVAGCGAMVANDGFETKLSKVKNPMVWTNLEVASLIITKKTMLDHLATWVTGRDCSTVRANRVGAYCVDWPEGPTPPEQVYCYSSIGRPTCNSQPYTQGNDHLIGFVPASTPIR